MKHTRFHLHSIRSRLSSGLLLSLIIVFILLWIIISQNIRSLSEYYITTRLQHDTETLLSAISFDTDNRMQLKDAGINPIYQRVFSGHYFQIQFKDQVFRSRSLWDQTLRHIQPASTDYVQSFLHGPQKQPLMALSAKFNKRGNDFFITIAEDLTPIKTSIHRFRVYFSLFALATLGILLFIQVRVLRYGLHPLKTTQQELVQLEKGEIDQLTTEVPDELSAIVDEINKLSVALNKRVKRSRDALGDLSHAIKKPLTVLQQINNRSDSLSNEDKAQLNEQINAIQQLTDRILKRARIAGNIRTGAVFNFENDLPPVIKIMRAMYPEKNIELETSLRVTTTTIDREDMLELLGNLVDNAWKWCRHSIAISSSQNANNDLLITIEDDGNAPDVDALNEQVSRGIRLDESVAGYGFGLAICADIVHDYDGSIHFTHSEKLGGFKAEISLPSG